MDQLTKCYGFFFFVQSTAGRQEEQLHLKRGLGVP